MFKIIANIVAKSPPAILVTLGGIGWLLHIDGAGVLLAIGVVLQILWLFLRR